MTDLSEDARQIAGSLFGLPKSSVEFRRPHAITARRKAALDELEAAGLIVVRPSDSFQGAIVYHAPVPLQEHWRWLLETYGVTGHPDPIRLVESDARPSQEVRSDG